jgi:predicted RNA-binding protein with RPS1 domain
MPEKVTIYGDTVSGEALSEEARQRIAASIKSNEENKPNEKQEEKPQNGNCNSC